MTHRFVVLTIFPEIFDSFLRASLVGKAVDAGRIAVDRVDIRDFASGPHRSVDDAPYGGGAGMVMMPGPVVDAIESSPPGHRVLLTPQGQRYTQDLARDLARHPTLVLVCGRYEGFDERIREWADREVTIGDFVLHGGEVAAMCVIESIARLGDGTLGNPESVVEESHTDGLLEYPQYTRPRDFRGREVPGVLTSGHHEAIRRWRREQQIRRTARRRPDLIEGRDLDPEEMRIVEDETGGPREDGS